MVEPTGVPARIEIRIPPAALTTDITAALMVTERKDLNNRIAESAGKITSAEIRREPEKIVSICSDSRCF